MMKTIMLKTMKTTFLATAALATIATAAHADELADFKALIEALTTKDATSQAAVNVPRGFKIHPTADAAPADAAAAVEEPFVEVKTSGYLKAGYIYNKIKDGSPLDKSSDIDVEAGVNVKGSVQSSLGEVGVTIQAKWDTAESTTNAASIALRDDGIVGFWQFADTMKLETGRGNAGRLENGIDKNTRRLWTFGNRRVRAENAGSGFFDRDAYNGFFGLAYADGPITLTARVHDATRGVTGALGSDDDAHGASLKGTYSSEMISFEAAGGYWGESNAKNLPIPLQTGVKWLAGVGSEIDVIEGVPISVAVQTGRLHNGTKSLKVSTSVGFTLTDTITAGFGAGWTKISNVPVGSTTENNHKEKVVHGEIYYAPLAQMVIGLEAEYYKDGRPAVAVPVALQSNDGFSAAIVTRYAF